MEKSSFFNSVNGDRRRDATDWAAYFASFIGNGVFPNPSTGVQVVSDQNMRIAVQPGSAWINGYYYTNTTKLSVQLDTADGSTPRIDRIVVQWSLVDRKIVVKVKKGAYNTSPVASALQRDAGIYELCLVDVRVNAGTTAISQANITDQRLNTPLCGIVAAAVNQIDTTAFNAQLQAWYNTLSIAENAGLMGLPVPSVLRKALEQMREKHDQE